MYWSAKWKNRTICSFESIMMKRETIPIVDVYVPIKRRATLEQKRVDEIAASILITISLTAEHCSAAVEAVAPPNALRDAQAHGVNSAISALASIKSFVSKPSVNQL